MTYWSLHTHTRESAGDALPSIGRVVDKAKELGYPALAITDHGTQSGAVEFYLACRKAGIKPLIGVEAYVAIDRLAGARPDTAHMGIVAYTETGYRNLCRLTTLANKNFRWKPVLDMSDLAGAHTRGELEGLLVTTGCWFGMLTKLLRTGDMGSAINVIAALRNWFGGHVYVEIQNHMVDDETHSDVDHCRLLHTFAEVHDLPTILGQDSHYLEVEDQEVHNTFKTLTSWSDDPDDAIFPGDGYHMVDTTWMEDHHAPDIFDRGMKGLAEIEAMADLVIPELESYHLKVPDTTVSGHPDTELLLCVSQLMGERQAAGVIPKDAHGVYADRIHDEVEVITASGFAGYLMLAKALADFMRANDIRYRVRGSATGSLVCWMLGITGYDPIKWNLSFERFLSTDQTKPPDIDFDVEHERRGEVVDWLGSKFYVTHIGTAMQYRIKSKSNDPDLDDSKGSLVVAFRARQRKLGHDPEAPIAEYWLRALRKIAGYNGIRKDGTFIDPPIKSFGKHPAGMLVAPDAETMALVPRRYVASSKTMTSTYDMDSVEKLGLVKLDVLGLRTLTAVRIAEELAGVHAEDFPLDDPRVYRLIGTGKTVGMFQLEGWSAAKGVRRMKPKTIGDVIAAMALFRPATAASGATESYLARRTNNERIPSRHPIIADATADTYGVLVYQEQALTILKDLGLSVEEVEMARKAIKASNANVGDAAYKLASLMKHIEDLAKHKGFDDTDIGWMAHAIQAYAGYCVVGDTVVTRSSGGRFGSQETTVKALFDVFNGPHTPARKKYRSKRGVTIMGRDSTDGRLRPFRVKDVWESGIKDVWEVRTRDGHSITATADHRHLTWSGFVEVGLLRVGDRLATMGLAESVSNPTGTGEPVGAHSGYHLLRREIRAIGECERCGETEGSLEIAHLDHDRSHNTEENLALLCNSCHKKHDWDTGRRKARHSRGREIRYSEIVEIRYVGQEMTYDLEMDSEDHSWVGNGVVTHNSFNLAHATAYGILAYQTAYFILHHPVAFWTGMLVAYEDAPAPYPDAPKPETTYIAAARASGIKIRAAHVNRSELTYCTDGKDIFKGITSIPNVGQIAAEELVAKSPFHSLDDLARRCAPGKVTGVKDLMRGHTPPVCPGVVRALAEAHALHGLKWEASSNLEDKAVRSTTISVANQMIKDVTGQRAGRKELGELYDAAVKTGEYAGKSKPAINQMLADTYLLAVEVTA